MTFLRMLTLLSLEAFKLPSTSMSMLKKLNLQSSISIHVMGFRNCVPLMSGKIV